VGEGEDLTTSIKAFPFAIKIQSFEPTFGKSTEMDEPPKLASSREKALNESLTRRRKHDSLIAILE